MPHAKTHMITHYHANDGLIVDNGENHGTWNSKPKTWKLIKGQLTHQPEVGLQRRNEVQLHLPSPEQVLQVPKCFLFAQAAAHATYELWMALVLFKL